MPDRTTEQIPELPREQMPDLDLRAARMQVEQASSALRHALIADAQPAGQSVEAR